MEGLSESTVLTVMKEIQKSVVYFNLMNSLQLIKKFDNFQDLITNPDVTAANLEERILFLIRESGYREKLWNIVYQYYMKYLLLGENVSQPKEPMDFIEKAQANWERRIIKSLNSICSELGIPLSRKRPVSEQKEFEAKWSELGTEDMDLSRFRPVYSPKDLLEVLTNIRSPNLSKNTNPEVGSTSVWGQIKVSLKVKSFQDLRKDFEELSGSMFHLGIDDVYTFSRPEIPHSFLQDRVTLGKIVLELNDSSLIREYAKQGSPPSLRAEMWNSVLGVDTCNADYLQYQHLKSCVFQHELMIDKLIFKDIHLTASNDDQYFVFEDLLYQILLLFSRDVSVSSYLSRITCSVPNANLRGQGLAIYPPSGVIPFHGFSMYAAPLCYVYEDPVILYLIFKELYCRYFYKLHNLSSQPQDILSLCLLFETLFQEHEPELFYRFFCHEIYPLKIVIKWMIRAFSGYLAIDQILLLWDRILAYNSLDILPVLAVAILSFRKTVLLQAENQNMVESMLADISTVKVIPLLQGVLCASKPELDRQGL